MAMSPRLDQARNHHSQPGHTQNPTNPKQSKDAGNNIDKASAKSKFQQMLEDRVDLILSQSHGDASLLQGPYHSLIPQEEVPYWSRPHMKRTPGERSGGDYTQPVLLTGAVCLQPHCTLGSCPSATQGVAEKDLGGILQGPWIG